MRGIDVMYSFLGKQEKRDRKELIEFFKKEKIVCDPYTTPWCAAMVGACERSVDNAGTGSLMARSYLKYGKKIDPADAQHGDIVIFSRGSNGYSGHVAYFVEYDHDNNTIVCLGGNQSDMVCYAHYSKDRLLGVRRSD